LRVGRECSREQKPLRRAEEPCEGDEAECHRAQASSACAEPRIAPAGLMDQSNREERRDRLQPCSTFGVVVCSVVMFSTSSSPPAKRTLTAPRLHRSCRLHLKPEPLHESREPPAPVNGYQSGSLLAS
jgi:hypothetical protein